VQVVGKPELNPGVTIVLLPGGLNNVAARMPWRASAQSGIWYDNESAGAGGSEPKWGLAGPWRAWAGGMFLEQRGPWQGEECGDDAVVQLLETGRGLTSRRRRILMPR